MDKIKIIGGTPLKGEIIISGAKNAALPLLAASLLTEESFHLTNVPDLMDIQSMCALLSQLGVEITDTLKENRLTLKAANILHTTAPYELVRKMRASILVLGPLLARYGQATVSLPGGCAIGARPVDLHLEGLKQLGAHITLEEGYVVAQAPKGLHGATITMPLISVTATENIMMAAVLAKGQTKIINGAREPEVIDLALCLNAMGARISGMGTDTLIIEGVESLKGCTHRVIPDRIETGTYAIAAAITQGDILLKNSSLDLLTSFAAQLSKTGTEITETKEGIRVKAPQTSIRGVDIMTEPFPGFATDLQAQMMALMTTCDGASLITETIFENRFMHVPELARMGADITIHGSSALVRGVKKLKGTQVMATDLRASVSLVLTALRAEGETIVNRVYHLDRGYEKVEDKLRGCGATIERLLD